MKRAKLLPERRAAIKNAYRKLYRSGLNFGQALEQIEADPEKCPEVEEIIEFYRASKRGVLGLYAEGELPDSTDA
jgi:UDP-N-acetylglucosamine acyltransferase